MDKCQNCRRKATITTADPTDSRKLVDVCKEHYEVIREQVFNGLTPYEEE